MTETAALTTTDAELVEVDDDTRKRAVSQRGLQIVESMAAEGKSVATIAKRLRMSTQTFYTCCRRQPDVADRLARGRGALQDRVMEKLIEKVEDGDTVACLFLMKSEFGRRDTGTGGTREDTAITNINAENVQINVPPTLSAEQFAQLLKQQRPLVPADTEKATP